MVPCRRYVPRTTYHVLRTTYYVPRTTYLLVLPSHADLLTRHPRTNPPAHAHTHTRTHAQLFKSCAENEKPDEKWIVFDGPINAMWVESMNR